MPIRRSLTALATLGATLGAALSLSACLSVLPAIAPKAKNVEADISPAFPYASKYADVLGSRIHYVEAGEGQPILLIHGNPTSSYLWRNVIPGLTDRGRVIALDMIGMGKSGKPDIPYRFADHVRYVEAFIEELALKNVTLVLHDWGGAVGIDYAARHPDNIRGIAFMEAVVMPMSLKDADMGARYIFGRLRDPEDNRKLIIEENFFVETLLPMMSGRELSEAEMSVYRAPYRTKDSRRPVAQWPLEIPLDGTPADNVARIGENYEWLRGSDVPVFLITAEPGMIFRPKIVAQLEKEIPRLRTASIGSGLHYLQEVQPTRIAAALSAFMATLPE